MGMAAPGGMEVAKAKLPVQTQGNKLVVVAHHHAWRLMLPPHR
jgi:hypothetical protein